MRIRYNKNLVEFEPESAAEVAAMEVVWKRLISCTGTSGKLAPVGEFTPGHKNVATFAVEGKDGGVSGSFAQEAVLEDGTYICNECNRYVDLVAGDKVPVCCGRPMERMD